MAIIDIKIKTKINIDDEQTSHTVKFDDIQSTVDSLNVIKKENISFENLFGNNNSFGYIEYDSGINLTEKYSYDPQKVLQKGYYNIGKIGNNTITNECILSTSISKSKLDKSAGTFTISISNTGKDTMIWTAKVDNTSWLTITSGSSGSNTGTINCSYIANNGLSARTGKIIVTSSGSSGSPKTISISQDKVNVVVETYQVDYNYQSIYQLPLKVPYCSNTASGGEYDTYPCNKETLGKAMYRHIETYTGFKKQWNPNDTKRRCQQDYGSCSNVENLDYALNITRENLGLGQNTNICSPMFRYYIPKGTMLGSLTIYGPPVNGQCATIARFRKPPTFTIPNSFDPFLEPEKYPDIIPTSQYPNGRQQMWNGKNLQQLEDNDWIAVNEGGHITVLYNNTTAVLSGGWLYISFFKYDANYMATHSFRCSTNLNTYKSWYDNEAQFDQYGDPIN